MAISYPITNEELRQLVKEGMNSRALGSDRFSNPYLKSENCPRATGDSLERWAAKHDAWQLGWDKEDLVRT